MKRASNFATPPTITTTPHPPLPKGSRFDVAGQDFVVVRDDGMRMQIRHPKRRERLAWKLQRLPSLDIRWRILLFIIALLVIAALDRDDPNAIFYALGAYAVLILPTFYARRTP